MLATKTKKLLTIFVILLLAFPSNAFAGFKEDADPDLISAVTGRKRPPTCEEKLGPTTESLQKCAVALQKKDVRVLALDGLVKDKAAETNVVKEQLERAYEREAKARGPLVSVEIIAIGSFLLGALAMWTATR